VTQYIELEFSGKSQIACYRLNGGWRGRNKKGWYDGLVWCGSSGLYFGTQPIDSFYPCILLPAVFYRNVGSRKWDRAMKFIIQDV